MCASGRAAISVFREVKTLFDGNWILKSYWYIPDHMLYNFWHQNAKSWFLNSSVILVHLSRNCVWENEVAVCLIHMTKTRRLDWPLTLKNMHGFKWTPPSCSPSSPYKFRPFSPTFWRENMGDPWAEKLFYKMFHWSFQFLKPVQKAFVALYLVN